jgi:rhamnosyltransferase
MRMRADAPQEAHHNGTTPRVSVSIVILTKNEEKRIGACLDAIFRQDFRGDLEVLVIDSGSTDRTVEIVSEFPVCIVRIEPQQFRHGATRHLGIVSTTAPLVVLLNGDAVPANEQWLSTLVRAMQPDDIAAAYSRQVPHSDAYPMEEFFLMNMYPPDRTDDPSKPGGVFRSFFSSVSCVIRRSAYNIELFAEDILIAEDQEWSLRMIGREFRIIYAPDSLVFHSHNYSFGRAFRRFFDLGYTAKRTGLQRKMSTRVTLVRAAMYPWAEMVYLVRMTRARWIPYAVAYDFMKLAGYCCGSIGAYLPQSMARRPSLNMPGNVSNPRAAGD